MTCMIDSGAISLGQTNPRLRHPRPNIVFAKIPHMVQVQGSESGHLLNIWRSNSTCINYQVQLCDKGQAQWIMVTRIPRKRGFWKATRGQESREKWSRKEGDSAACGMHGGTRSFILPAWHHVGSGLVAVAFRAGALVDTRNSSVPTKRSA